ncbi:MAG: hypothetical protein N3A64_02195, partial [Desulfobacterota bacterium]|nr:hypothetical protein [Thermodesulfobacteriota bacterium]
MKTLTLKQKSLIFIGSLIVLIIGLAIFFIARLKAISETYKQVTEITFPQQKVSSAMALALVATRLNVNNLVQVDRERNKYDFYKSIIQAKLDEYEVLE